MCCCRTGKFGGVGAKPKILGMHSQNSDRSYQPHRKSYCSTIAVFPGHRTKKGIKLCVEKLAPSEKAEVGMRLDYIELVRS